MGKQVAEITWMNTTLIWVVFRTCDITPKDYWSSTRLVEQSVLQDVAITTLKVK